MKEFYKKYRPDSFSELVGQAESVDTLTELCSSDNVPHALLLTGPSGCGKTTIARILRKEVDCGKHDFREINTADFTGVDMVRDIRTRIDIAPMDGSSRMWLVDECHQISTAGQNAFLKMLEDTPSHVYFVLATTDPKKLIAPIRNRCTQIKLQTVSDKDIEKLLRTTAKKEKLKIADEVFKKLVEHA